MPTLRNTSSIPQSTPSTNFSLTTLFTKHQHISPDVIASYSQTLFENICHDNESSSFEETSLNPTCQRAMDQEFEAS